MCGCADFRCTDEKHDLLLICYLVKAKELYVLMRKFNKYVILESV
jgi:hypothetical protein